jgi:L-cysteine S-thiosulfotransferase
MDRRQRLRRLRHGADPGRLRFLVLSLLLVAGIASAQDPRKSGYEFMSRDTQAMQDDAVTGPAVLSLLDGEALWQRKAGASNKACAECHQSGMKGVAARYPAPYNGKLVNLEQRINACRTDQQQASAFAFESKDLLALAAYVGRQSRGLPISVSSSSESGKAFFYRRQGQLNLSCSQCHDDNAGKKLAGSAIPQAHPTGYPIYRLEWQGLGSLQRRLRNCLTGMRAENYALGSPELVELEQFLMFRARGMTIETPAVRP